MLAVQPGFGGQKFDRSVLEKVQRLREKHPRLRYVAVDGGVDALTGLEAVGQGANVLIAGSFVFERHVPFEGCDTKSEGSGAGIGIGIGIGIGTGMRDLQGSVSADIIAGSEQNNNRSGNGGGGSKRPRDAKLDGDSHIRLRLNVLRSFFGKS